MSIFLLCINESPNTKTVIRAYYATDPDTMDLRDEDDPVKKMCPDWLLKKRRA